MHIVNGYNMTKDFSAENAGFCKWGFAEKGGYEFFIKEFLAPKYPLDSHKLSPEMVRKKKKQCEQFYAEKTRLYRAIELCRTGNVVIVEDFFREGAKYYAVMQRITPSTITIEQISKLDLKRKYVLMRSLLYSFAKLHSRSIVHADVKPENILIQETPAGFYTGKIIDFDSSFFEDSVPEEIQGDQIYLAPEVRLYMMEEEASITTKIDIFALGILFHQYWSGKLPIMYSDYEYLFEAVLDESPVLLDNDIPIVIKKIISKMLEKNPDSRPSAAQILRTLDRALTDRVPVTPVTSEKGKKGFRHPGDLE